MDGWEAVAVAGALSADFGIGVRDGRFCTHLLADRLVGRPTRTAFMQAGETLTGTHFLRSGFVAEEDMTTSAATGETRSWEQYLLQSTVPRDVIDTFIERPHWASFDPELGYVLHNSLVRWGVDGSRTIETFRPDGARSRFLYAGRKPRINAYGNSFTECTQVSDGETWQEYLAGHLAEPIGNFGVGGYGVYQAYRRMLRVERTSDGAEYTIFYVWGDDPSRSVKRCRWGVLYPGATPADFDQRLFNGNPWAHVEIDLETGSFVELENPLSTPDSLYAMCDPQWMLEHLRDDLAMQLAVYAGDPDYGQPGNIDELDRPKIERLAEVLDFPFDWGTDADSRRQAAMLLNRYGQRATIFILEQARAFARSAGKTLLTVLNYTARTDHFRGSVVAWDGMRRDQEILNHLSVSGVPFFDMNAVHEREYDHVGGSYHGYLARYMVDGDGHYNPRGNHFFAYALKDRLLELLDPKPVPYQDRSPDPVGLVLVAVGGRVVDGQSPPSSCFGGAAGLSFGGLAPAQNGGGGRQRRHVAAVHAAVVGVGGAGRELRDDPGHPDLGDDRKSWLADFLVAEVGGRRGDADLVLFERFAGECGVTIRVEGLRGSAGKGEGAVILLLNQHAAGDRADQPAVHLGNRQTCRDGTVMPHVLDGRIAHALSHAQ